MPFSEGARAHHSSAYTLGEAAKAIGFSKSTLSRAIKTGKLSAHRLEDGSYQIDLSELERWDKYNGHRNGQAKRIATPEDNGRAEQRRAGEVETLRALVARMEDEVNDLRSRLDAEAEERRKLVAILVNDQHREAPSATVAPRRGPLDGLLRWLRGEGGPGQG